MGSADLDTSPHYLISSDISIIVALGSTASQDFSYRPINHRLLEHTLQHARGWLETCLRDHPKYSEVPKYTPKRLLEISRSFDGSPSVTIVEDCAPTAYAALSYKWGGIHEPRLTRSRLHGATASALQFDLEALPKTIADAVKVSEAFGIKHLWVDALCIIQDDGADKATEIGQMSQIYRHATVTILASRANSTSEGFLHCRHGKGCHENATESFLSKCNFQLPYRTSSGEQSSIIITKHGDVHQHKEPLDARGWAFQEALLSPHIISYGKFRTVFHCSHLAQSEVYRFSDNGNLIPDSDITTLRRHVREISSKHYTGSNREHNQQGPDHNRPVNGSVSVMTDNVARHRMIPQGYEWNRTSALQEWSILVRPYTKRELSNPRDRLNAAAALAEVFAIYLKDGYVAGFGRSDLLKALLWTQRQRWWGMQRRPTEYCGPTWSWGSIMGEVSLKYRPNFCRDRDLQILHCHAKLVDDATKFGAVDSGFLKVRGKIVHGTITSHSRITSHDLFSDYSVNATWPTEYEPEGAARWENLEYDYFPDALEQEFMKENSTFTVVLFIFGFDRKFLDFSRRCYCLVLKKAPGGLYTR